MRNSTPLWAAATALSLLTTLTQIQADTIGVTISATANIYSAGLSVPIAPGGGGAGTLPFFIPILPGQTSFQLTASGNVSQFYSGFYHGPDGLPGYAGNVSPYGGISGFITDQVLPLAAVFLTDAAPQDPAPPTLNFSSAALGQNFLTLSPAIGQVFFVGDGHTTVGQWQTFFVPAGATRLFLGFPDCPNSQGLPGSYGDNYGSLLVSAYAIPEPSGCLIAAVALPFLCRSLRRTT